MNATPVVNSIANVIRYIGQERECFFSTKSIYSPRIYFLLIMPIIIWAEGIKYNKICTGGILKIFNNLPAFHLLLHTLQKWNNKVIILNMYFLHTFPTTTLCYRTNAYNTHTAYTSIYTRRVAVLYSIYNIFCLMFGSGVVGVFLFAFYSSSLQLNLGKKKYTYFLFKLLLKYALYKFSVEK